MAGLLIESPTQRRLQSDGVGRLKGHRDGLCLSPERAGAIRGADVFIRKTDKTQRQGQTQDGRSSIKLTKRAKSKIHKLTSDSSSSKPKHKPKKTLLNNLAGRFFGKFDFINAFSFVILIMSKSEQGRKGNCKCRSDDLICTLFMSQMTQPSSRNEKASLLMHFNLQI